MISESNKVLTAFILSVMCCISSAISNADTDPDPVTMDQFSSGSELTEADAEIRRVELQPVIITGIQRRDLRDIRVYDANNRAMPSALIRKDGKISTSSKSLTITAQYDKGKISAYLVDRGKDTKPAIDSLKLKWRAGKAPKILSFKIEQSSNGKSWQPLINSANVINFDFNGIRLDQNEVEINQRTERFLRLDQNEVEINQRTERFLRLVPLENKVFPALSGITATLASKPHTDYWWIASGNLQADAGKPDRYQFSLTTGVRPVAFKISTPLNTVITGKLYNYAGTDTKQRTLVKNDFEAYALSINRKAVYSRPIDISKSPESRWEIDAAKTLRLDQAELPDVLAAYPQYQLFFASDGDAPYTLVWGNRDAGTKQHGDLIDRIKAGKQILKDIPEVKTTLLLDNAGLVELVASRSTVWQYLAALLVMIVVGAGAVVGFRRYRSKNR